MTIAIAISRKTGKPIGQVTAVKRPSIPEMLNLPHGQHVTILCRDGVYLTVPRDSVRLEEVR